MGATKERLATAAALLRAAAIGAELDAILGDVGLQKLSREAWLRMAAELAGGADLAELRARIEALPYLQRLVGQTAQRWARDGQDRPVPDPVFADGDNATAAYAERIMGGLSVGDASAIVAVLVADMAPPERWGRLGDFAEVPALLDPLQHELDQLDDQLAAELRVRDIAWTADGRPELCAGPVGIAIALDRGTAAEPASAIARAARYAARGVQLAA